VHSRGKLTNMLPASPAIPGEFQLHVVPMDSDIMSMEQPQVFRECQLLNDRTALFQAARAIMQLQVV